MSLRKIMGMVIVVCLLATQVATVAFAEEIPAEVIETVEDNAEQEEEPEGVKAEEAGASADIVLTAELDDVIVTLKADKDAFENEGELSLVVKPAEIEDTEEEAALDALEKENVAKRVTYDITVLDGETPIEPVKEVKVFFELKDAPSGADGVNIYHHDEEEGIEKIATQVLKDDAKEETAKVGEAKTEKDIEVREVSEEELADTDDVEIIDDVTVDSFSLYTVDFTYKDKTISIAGDSTVNKLDDIVSQLGIKEEVTEATAYQDEECTEEADNNEVKSSDGETLYSVYEEGDTWYVDAVNAFQTEHGLVIKTADGSEYKIKVTDLAGVKYIDADGTEKTCTNYTVVDSTMTGTWNAGWYVVNSNVTMTGASVQVSGVVHLILKDGCELKVTGAKKKAGICVTNVDSSNPSNVFTIYGQSAGTGKLTSKGGGGGAGIGGGNKGSGSNITINGGNVEATGGESGAGIGGGYDGSGSDITINGGEVTATGFADGSKFGGAGIGGGDNGSGSNITINGGTVIAKTDGSVIISTAAGIGGGTFGAGNNITINGGRVEATGGNEGAGIGGGNNGSGSDITINGGEVTAKGGKDDYGAGAGIGGGLSGNGNDIFAATDVIIKAGDSADPTTVITHTATTDIAGDLAGKQYVTAKKIATTISLDANEGTSGTKTQVTVSYGSAMPALLSTELPARNGYEFTGYYDASVGGTKYYNADGSSAKNWDKTDATATLYAQWTVNTYTVTFNMQDHGTQVESQTVPAGGIVSKPTDPSAEGYTFGGWYKETGCTNAWNFDTDTVSADTTLFAKWTRKGGDEPTTKPTSSGGGSWTSAPTLMGSPAAPVSNGSWVNTNGVFTYVISDQPFRHVRAWITYSATDGKQYTGCFYFDKSGKMTTGWQFLDGIWYYFEPTAGPTQGMMYISRTTPDGYVVDAEGKWVQG